MTIKQLLDVNKCLSETNSYLVCTNVLVRKSIAFGFFTNLKYRIFEVKDPTTEESAQVIFDAAESHHIIESEFDENYKLSNRVTKVDDKFVLCRNGEVWYEFVKMQDE